MQGTDSKCLFLKSVPLSPENGSALKEIAMRSFAKYPSCQLCSLTKNFFLGKLDLVSSFLLWLWAHIFIDKHADFPADTGGDARRDLYQEWLGLTTCIHSYHERFVFALYRAREAIMIGYEYNRTGLLAITRKFACNEFFIK